MSESRKPPVPSTSKPPVPSKPPQPELSPDDFPPPEAFSRPPQPQYTQQIYDAYDQHSSEHLPAEHLHEEEHYEGETHEYATVPMVQPPLHSHPPDVPMPAPPSRQIGPPPIQGAPYRVPLAPMQEPATLPWAPVVAAKKPSPILGSAIALYGIALWGFVIMGQFATSWISGTPIQNGTALFFVFVLVMTGWGLALHRSRQAVPPATAGRLVWRGIGIFGLAFVFFFVTIIMAAIFGQNTYGHDFLIAFTLVAASVAAMIVGPRMTMPVRPQLTHGHRFAVVCMWIGGVIVTFIAGAELASNG
jgi:hypothetical protein